MPAAIREAANSFDVQDHRPIKLWAEDEARFGRMNNPKRCWAPPRTRPIVQLQRIREFIYVFAATCPWTGETYSLILPLCDTNAMQLFLNKFAEEYHDYKNIIVVDQAAWHKTKKLLPIDNVRFIYLPAGSPELNPAEHLWEHIREKYLGNRFFNSLDEVEAEMITILEKLCYEREIIKNLTGFHWMKIA